MLIAGVFIAKVAIKNIAKCAVIFATLRFCVKDEIFFKKLLDASIFVQYDACTLKTCSILQINLNWSQSHERNAKS